MSKLTDQRMGDIKAAGCVIAWHRLSEQVPCEVHHLTVGSRHGAPRRGDRFTVGINGWSHRGVLIYPHWSATRHREVFGPSYAKEPKAFRQEFPDDWLLQQTDTLIGWKEPQRLCDCFLAAGAPSGYLCTTPFECRLA